jgi:hypothetical protein
LELELIFTSEQERKFTVMVESNSAEFLWLNPSTSNALSDSSISRREMMQKVALRRKKMPKIHHPNSRQLPLFVVIESILAQNSLNQRQEKIFHGAEPLDKDGCLQTRNANSSFVEIEASRFQPSLTQVRLSTVTYPSLFAKFNVYFRDLSILASWLHEIGLCTSTRWSQEPTILIKINSNTIVLYEDGRAK